MGNTTNAPPPGGYDFPSNLNEFPQYTYFAALGGGQAIQSLRCRHDHGEVVAKVYIKPDSDRRLGKYQKIVQELKDKFSLGVTEQPGVLPPYKLEETDKAGLLFRQYFAYNLAERLHSHPFLISIEKRWISFQLLKAISQCHAQGICHGDIKSENVMLTSWNWSFLTDIAFFKPTFLPIDNPADYQFFFDAKDRRSARDRCFLAPERFVKNAVEKADKTSSSGDGQLTEAMDIFSAGCVIAEVFLMGEPLFDLPQLLAYSEGKYDPGPAIDKIDDPEVRTLVREMVSINPSSRNSAMGYISKYTPSIFPPYFDYLYRQFAKLLSPEFSESDAKISYVTRNLQQILDEVLGSKSHAERPFAFNRVYQDPAKGPSVQPSATASAMGSPIMSPAQSPLSSPRNLPNKEDQENQDLRRTQRNVDELARFSKRLESRLSTKPDRKGKHAVADTKHHEPVVEELEFKIRSRHGPVADLAVPESEAWNNGLAIVIALVCSCIQNARTPVTQLAALDLLLKFSQDVDDEVRLGRVIPYCVAMLSAEKSEQHAASVRATACQVLAQTLERVEKFSQSDAHIFQEYIFPALARFPSDGEELVRLAYATHIGSLATSAKRFLDILYYTKDECEDGSNEESYDHELGLIQNTVLATIVDMLTVGGSRVKQCLLNDITRLCVFLRRRRVHGELLPHLITVLNDRDWGLRAEFFKHIVSVSVFVGRAPFQSFVLPCIEQALVDTEELIVQRAVRALAQLCALGLLDKKSLVDLVASSKIQPLLCHPSSWIRNDALDLLAAIANAMGPASSYCYLGPSLLPFLQKPVLEVTRNTLVQCLKRPLSRREWDIAIKCKGIAPSIIEELMITRGSKPAMSIWMPRPPAGASAQYLRNMNARGEFPRVETMAAGKRPTHFEGSPLQKARDIGEGDDSLSSPLSVTFKKEYSSSRRGEDSDPEGGLSELRGASSHSNLHALAEEKGNGNGTPKSSMMYDEDRSNYDDEGLGVPGEFGFMNDPDLSDHMLKYIQRLSAQVQALSAAGAGSTSMIGSAMPTADKDDADIAQYASLDNVPVYAVESERTVLDDSFLISSPMADVQQAMLSSLGVQVYDPSAAPRGTMRATHVNHVNTLEDSMVVGGGGPGPIISPSAISPASRQMEGPGPTADARLTIQKAEVIPEEYRRMLQIPLPPINLGMLVPDTISTSAFYKNYHRLEGDTSEPRDPRDWRPRGTLVSTLSEHKGAVNQLAVSRDNVFMASGSDDGTVKIWDCARLKSMPFGQSQLTYSLPQRGRVVSVVVCDSSHSVAVASDNGTVGVFKVDCTRSPEDTRKDYTYTGGVVNVKSIEELVEGPILQVEHFNTVTESLLTYSTRRGYIHGWDLRSRLEAWKLKMEDPLGIMTSMCVGPSPYCILAGTARGFIVLWDLRFELPVQTWRHSAKTPIIHMTPHDSPTMLDPQVYRKMPTKGPMVVASAEGTNQTAAFDLFTGECRVVFRVNPATEGKSLSNVVQGGTAVKKLGKSKDRSSVKIASPIASSTSTSSAAINNNSNASGHNYSQSSAAVHGAHGAHGAHNPAGVHHSHSASLGTALKVSPLNLPSLRQFVGSESSNPSALDDALAKELKSASDNMGTEKASITGFLCCQEDFAITGGTDRILRYWDLKCHLDCYRVSGDLLDAAEEGTSVRYNSRGENATVVFEEVVTNDLQAFQDPESKPKSRVLRKRRGPVPAPTGHADAITDVKAIELNSQNRMIASAGRDGIVKLWM